MKKLFSCFSIKKMENNEKMLDEIISTKSNFDLTKKSLLSGNNEVFTSKSYAALLARNSVPYSHKKIADNYMIIKKVFKFQAVQSRITNVEKQMLAKYEFHSLEYTTAKKMFEELQLLQSLSSSNNAELKADADLIMEIREKELKYIDANSYATISNEIYKGYVALEQYFEEISRYRDVK